MRNWHRSAEVRVSENQITIRHGHNGTRPCTQRFLDYEDRCPVDVSRSRPLRLRQFEGGKLIRYPKRFDVIGLQQLQALQLTSIASLIGWQAANQADMQFSIQRCKLSTQGKMRRCQQIEQSDIAPAPYRRCLQLHRSRFDVRHRKFDDVAGRDLKRMSSCAACSPGDLYNRHLVRGLRPMPRAEPEPRQKPAAVPKPASKAESWQTRTEPAKPPTPFNPWQN